MVCLTFLAFFGCDRSLVSNALLRTILMPIHKVCDDAKPCVSEKAGKLLINIV